MHVDDRGRTEGADAELLTAGPAHPDRLADLPGQHGGLGGDASGVLAAKAATGRRHDDAHVLLFQVEGRGDLGPHREGGLGPGPDRHAPVVVPGCDRYPGLKGSGGDERSGVGGVNAYGRGSERAVRVALFLVERTTPSFVARRGVHTEELLETVVRRRVRDLPRGLETGQCRPRPGSVAGDDSDTHGGFHHHYIAAAIERSRVEVTEHGLEHGWSQHAAVPQPGHVQVRAKMQSARDHLDRAGGYVRRPGGPPL